MSVCDCEIRWLHTLKKRKKKVKYSKQLDTFFEEEVEEEEEGKKKKKKTFYFTLGQNLKAVQVVIPPPKSVYEYRSNTWLLLPQKTAFKYHSIEDLATLSSLLCFTEAETESVWRNTHIPLWLFSSPKPSGNLYSSNIPIPLFSFLSTATIFFFFFHILTNIRFLVIYFDARFIKLRFLNTHLLRIVLFLLKIPTFVIL